MNYFYAPYKKPRTSFPWVTVLFAFFLGPLGLLISGFIRLAGLALSVNFLLIFFSLLTPQPASSFFLLLTLLWQLIAIPWMAWRAHKSYEEGSGTTAGAIGASKSKSGTLDAALSGYRQQFIDIGYGVKAATTGNYDAILSTSLKPNAALDERKVLGAAFGVTDGRYYATYFYTESMADKAVQVSGVYVGAQEAELSPTRLRELLPDPLPIEDSIWISEGWLLTETQAETVTIDTAMRQWSLLNEVLDAEEEDISGLKENTDCAPIDAARKLFPEF
jgi:hypothetical protein